MFNYLYSLCYSFKSLIWPIETVYIKLHFYQPEIYGFSQSNYNLLLDWLNMSVRDILCSYSGNIVVLCPFSFNFCHLDCFSPDLGIDGSCISYFQNAALTKNQIWPKLFCLFNFLFCFNMIWFFFCLFLLLNLT